MIGTVACCFKQFLCPGSVVQLNDELDKGFILLTDVCIDCQIFLLSLRVWHVGILCGFDSTLKHTIVIIPSFLIFECSSSPNNTIDVALEVIQLIRDFSSFGKPCKVNLTVCHSARFSNEALTESASSTCCHPATPAKER